MVTRLPKPDWATDGHGFTRMEIRGTITSHPMEVQTNFG